LSDFLDTNVLLYADDLDGGAKTGAARELVRRCIVDRTGVVSTQILQEYYVNARKKLKMEGSAARARVEIYSALEVVTVTPSLVLAAIDLNRLDSVSFWDALVVRAAELAGCDRLWSEDLQTGRRFGGVVVANPFALG
jgi:predicted nucleic acid-binding protein